MPGRGPRGSSRGKREEEPVGDGARAAVARAVEDLALGEERRAAAAVELRRVGAAFGGEERKRGQRGQKGEQGEESDAFHGNDPTITPTVRATALRTTTSRSRVRAPLGFEADV